MKIERSTQNIKFNYAEALALMRKAFPNCQKLDDWKILSGGALNTTYKIQLGHHLFALRIYVRDRSLCKREKAIHHLIAQSISTPKLIYADEVSEPWAYSIFEFVSGVHISEVPHEEKTSLSHELGRLLASIHAFKFPKAGLFGDGMVIKQAFESGSSPYFEETYSVLSKSKNVLSRLGEQLTENALNFIQKNKDFFPTIKKDNISLTHSDFKPVNLLYTDNKKVYVLDWEFAHAGSGILDFSTLLRHRHQFPLDIRALESSYLHFGGNLPAEWLRSAFIADFVNIVQLMDRAPDRPKLFQQLNIAIQNTIHHFESVSDLYRSGNKSQPAKTP